MEKKGLVSKSLFSLFLLAIFVFLLVNLSQTFLVSAEANNTTTEVLQHSWFRDTTLVGITFDLDNSVYFIGLNGEFGVYNMTSNISENLSATDPGNWMGTTIFNSLTYDSSNDLVYFVGQSGKFGVYNRTSNISENLSGTDPGNWMGTSNLNSVIYDLNTSLVYLVGISTGKFGVYNRTSNLSENLNTTYIGNWGSDSSFFGVAHNPRDGLIYIAGNVGAFGAYNRTSNLTENLNDTDSGNWMSTNRVEDLVYNSQNNLIYLGGGGGGTPNVFASYNRTSNLTENLNDSDSGNWMGSTAILALSFDSISNLIYLGGASNAVNGLYGFYNVTSNVSEDLHTSDPSNWLGANPINDLAFDSTNNLNYLVGNSGVFGAHNKTTNVTEDFNLPNDWVRFNSLLALRSVPNQNLIYFGGENGIFGFYNRTLNSRTDLRETDSEDWVGNAIFRDIDYDVERNLVYFVGGTTNIGFFGSYNLTSNVSQNLSSGNWIYINYLNDVAYDSNNSLIYLVGQNGKFGVYNISSNFTENLNVTASWMALDTTGIITSVVYNPRNGLVYIGGNTIGASRPIFGVYNRTANITFNLNQTGGNLGSDDFALSSNDGLVYDSNNNLIYFLCGGLGVYNVSSNVSENLNSTDSGDWVGTGLPFGLTYDSSNDLVYFGGGGGLFGVYNRTSNTTEDLRATDTGDWIGTTSIFKTSYDSQDNLVYLSGDNGIFGYYNRTSNTSSPVNELVTSATSEDEGGSGAVSSSAASQTISIGSVSGGGSATARITNPKIDIRNVTIFPKENVENASITVSTSSASTTLLIASTLGTVYQSFDINPVAIENENLNNVTLDFRVNKSWLSENNYTYNDVVLYRLHSTNETWQELPTASITEDEAYYYFTSVSPGFSTFTIFVRKLPCDIGALRCFNNEVQLCVGNTTWIVAEKCSGSCVLGKCTDSGLFGEARVSIKSIFFYAAIILVVSAAIVFVFIKLRRENK